MTAPQQTFKVALMGFYGVGKTTMILRFTDKSRQFTGVEYICGMEDEEFVRSFFFFFFFFFFFGHFCLLQRLKNVTVNGSEVTLSIWDRPRDHRVSTRPYSYFRTAACIMIVFDLTDRESFQEVTQCWAIAQRYGPESPLYVLVANKCESAARQVSLEEAQRKADELGIRLFETSVLNDINVDLVFQTIGEELVRLEQEKRQKETPAVVPQRSPCACFLL
jgi:GTPase SAR1 family protein